MKSTAISFTGRNNTTRSDGAMHFDNPLRDGRTFFSAPPSASRQLGVANDNDNHNNKSSTGAGAVVAGLGREKILPAHLLPSPPSPAFYKRVSVSNGQTIATHKRAPTAFSCNPQTRPDGFLLQSTNAFRRSSPAIHKRAPTSP